MDMIMDIIGSAGFGTVVGGFFGWLGKREERENMKMKFNHEVSMLKAKTAAAAAAAKLSIEQAKVAGSLALEKVEAEAFVESQKVTSKWAEGIKSMVRPVILALLMWQTYTITQSLESINGGLEGLPAEDVLGLYRIIVLSITGLTATAVGWYFAARSSKQFDKLLERWQ